MSDDEQIRVAKLLGEHETFPGANFGSRAPWCISCGAIPPGAGVHQATMLRAAGLLVPVPPSPHSHRGGSRACRAFDEALGNAGYDPEWIGSAGPESVWSDARAHPGGHDLVRTGRRDADHPLAEHLRVDAPAPSSVEPELIGHVRDAARLQRDRVAPLGCPSGRHNGSGRSRQPGRTYRRRRGGNSRRRRSAPLPNGDRLSLCWSRYLGLALTWGVALCQASSDCDEDA